MARKLIAGLVIVALAGGVGAVVYLRGGKPPATVTLMYTADTRGVLEPKEYGCDCAQGTITLGGLAQRATSLKGLGAGRPEVLLLDGGGVALSRNRARLVLRAMGQMGYDVVGVGRADLRVGETFFQAARGPGIDVVCYPPTSGTARFAQTHVIRRVAGREIAIIGLGATAGNRLPLDDLARLLKKLRRESDAVVALSQLGVGADRELLRRKGIQGRIDVLAGNASAAMLRQPEMVGSTLLVPTTFEGQQIVLVDMKFPPRGRPECTYSRQDIVEGTRPDPGIVALLSEALLGSGGGSPAPRATGGTGEPPQASSAAGP